MALWHAEDGICRAHSLPKKPDTLRAIAALHSRSAGLE